MWMWINGELYYIGHATNQYTSTEGWSWYGDHFIRYAAYFVSTNWTEEAGG